MKHFMVLNMYGLVEYFLLVSTMSCVYIIYTVISFTLHACTTSKVIIVHLSSGLEIWASVWSVAKC